MTTKFVLLEYFQKVHIFKSNHLLKGVTTTVLLQSLEIIPMKNVVFHESSREHCEEIEVECRALQTIKFLANTWQNMAISMQI